MPPQDSKETKDQTKERDFKLFAFRVVSGFHSEGLDENKQPLVYGKGQTVHTDNDLRKHNFRHSTKFELTSHNLDQLTVQELKDVAAKEGIKVKGLDKKDELLDAIVNAPRNRQQ